MVEYKWQLSHKPPLTTNPVLLITLLLYILNKLFFETVSLIRVLVKREFRLEVTKNNT